MTTLAAAVAGVAHQLHRHAAAPTTPAWLRAALTGPGGGLATALTEAVGTDGAVRAVLRAILEIGDAANLHGIGNVADLCDVVESEGVDGRLFARLVARLATDRAVATIMDEVDEIDRKDRR